VGRRVNTWRICCFESQSACLPPVLISVVTPNPPRCGATTSSHRGSAPHSPQSVTTPASSATSTTQGPSWGYLRVNFQQTLSILAINAHKMAQRTTQWLQERHWNAPTKGLAWTPVDTGLVCCFESQSCFLPRPLLRHMLLLQIQEAGSRHASSLPASSASVDIFCLICFCRYRLASFHASSAAASCLRGSRLPYTGIEVGRDSSTRGYKGVMTSLYGI
jgi:hypothetical protein